MPIITIFRIVDTATPFDYFKGQLMPQDNINMRLERQDPTIDPEILDKPENPWRTAYQLEWDDQIGEFVNDFIEPVIQTEWDTEQAVEQLDENILPNVLFHLAEQHIAVFKSDKEESDALFDDVLTGLENSNLTNVYKLLQTVGVCNFKGFTHYPCLNCLTYGWDGGDEFALYREGRCCHDCNNQPLVNHVHEEIFVKGTWCWDTTVERDEKYEQERLFDMVVDAMLTCNETEFESILDNCGIDGGFVCLTCLQTKVDMFDRCLRCWENYPSHDDASVAQAKLLNCGTWLWSTAMTRGDDCSCKDCLGNIDAGLDDRDYYSEDYDN